MENRAQKVTNLYEKIENNLYLVGSSAIEDKLQDGVPECIATLSKANIKIWVLTGDKQETAINIGYSCQLLTNDMDVYTIESNSEIELIKELKEKRHLVTENLKRMDYEKQRYNKIINNIYQTELDHNNNIKNNSKSNMKGDNSLPMNEHNFTNLKEKDPRSGGFATIYEKNCIQQGESAASGNALVINGQSLVYALSPNCEKDFLELACMCKAVICCRVTPGQKKAVVDLVKMHKKAITLAVGDGANDVSMIKCKWFLREIENNF